MSVLTLVRHGQASFFADDYDRLTSLGEQQSRLLGEYWARQGRRFDAVYAGPRARQQRSAEIAGVAMRQAGATWRDPVLLPGLDEFDLHGIVHQLAPEYFGQNAEFAALVNRYRASVGEREKMQNFQRMFEPLLVHWQSRPDGDARLESWIAFRRRVEQTIREIVEVPGQGRRVAVFTSGGFIGNSVRHALVASDRTALELAWRLRNSSLTEFVFTQDRFTLDCFNAVPHLEDPVLLTYR